MWVYALTLSERVSSGQLHSDWGADHPIPPQTGVAIAGYDAVITSLPRVPQHQEFADRVSYIDDIEEYKELPNPDTAEWSPPYDAHPNGTIEFVE
jgi:hypothetical protein